MKTKIEFETLKKSIMKLGKAGKNIKKNMGIPLIKIEAKKDSLELSVNSNGFGAKVIMPAETDVEGTFVTTFSSINILTLRNCSGYVTIKSIEDHSLNVSYKNNQATTMLTKVNKPFIDIEEIGLNATTVSLPLLSLKGMLKNVMPFVDTSNASNMHSIKMNVSDDVDGLLKVEMFACDVKSVALRTAYAVKEGTYTGSQVFLPEQLKTSLDMIDDDEETISLSFSDDKIYITGENTLVCFSVTNKSFPAVESILASKNNTFAIKVNKSDILEALNCILYVQDEFSTNKSTDERNKLAVSLTIADGELTVGCSGVSSFNEIIDVETEGEVPKESIYFNTSMLKEIISNYPNEDVIIGGSALNKPFWFCCGENNDFVYAAMSKKIY